MSPGFHYNLLPVTPLAQERQQSPAQLCCSNAAGTAGVLEVPCNLSPPEEKVLFFCRNSKYLAPLCLLFSLGFRFQRLLFALRLLSGHWPGLQFTCFLLRQLCFLLFLFIQVFLDVFWKLLLLLQVFVLEGDENARAGSISLPCQRAGLFSFLPSLLPLLFCLSAHTGLLPGSRRLHQRARL